MQIRVHQYTSVQISIHQYTSVSISTHQYTRAHNSGPMHGICHMRGAYAGICHMRIRLIMNELIMNRTNHDCWVYIYICVCVFVCTCVHMFVCVSVCAYACARVRLWPSSFCTMVSRLLWPPGTTRLGSYVCRALTCICFKLIVSKALAHNNLGRVLAFLGVEGFA